MNQLNQIEVMERKLMRDQQIEAFQAQGKDSNSMNLGLQEYDWKIKDFAKLFLKITSGAS